MEARSTLSRSAPRPGPVRPSTPRSIWRASAPALVLGLFLVVGGFASGADAANALIAQLALLGLGAVGALRFPSSGDGPGGEAVVAKGLARFGTRRPAAEPREASTPLFRPLVAAMLLCLFVSWVASPVPRAGTVAVLLALPVIVSPWALAPSWRFRDAAPRAVAITVVATSAWSLIGVWHFGDAVAAAPLGHHNLMALWLVAILPLASLASWPLALGALATGLAALVATGSVGGALGGGVALLVALVSGGIGLGRVSLRVRSAAASVVAIALAAAVWKLLPRLGAMASGDDPSTAARRVYGLGAWRGFLERPLAGWGPGSAHWLFAEHLPPSPGVLPPGQVVASPHSLALQVLFELGAVGAVVALLVLVGLALQVDWTSRVARAGAAGLAGSLAVAVVSGPPLAVPSVWAAWIVAASAIVSSRQAVAGREEASVRTLPGAGWRRPVRAAVVVAITLGLAVPLVRFARAHHAWDLAAAASLPVPGLEPSVARSHLERARRLDPGFPLYTARWAELEAERPEGRIEAASVAMDRAARGARGVGSFWHLAGRFAQRAGDLDAARRAYVRACDLDPLVPMAPLRLALLRPRREDSDDKPADRRAARARALALEPRLAASPAWSSRSTVPPGDLAALTLGADADPATSLSLHAFRRRPWPFVIDRVGIDLEVLASLPPDARSPDALHQAAPDSLLEGLEPGCGFSPLPR